MKEIILHTSDVRQVTHQGSGLYMFQPHPGRKALTKEERQARRAAFRQLLEEAKKRRGADEGPGNDVA